MTQKLFAAHEPRNVFPYFANCENRLSYVLRDTYLAPPKEALKYAGKSIVKRDSRHSLSSLTRIVADSLTAVKIGFRGAFLTRDGALLATFPEFARVKHLEAFDICINDLLQKNGIPSQDGLFLCIADRGLKLDSGLSTGTLSATYLSDSFFTCYRNGIFARAVNEFSHHRPSGFRSIAPHMFVTKDIDSSAFFCNFSSDPDYAQTANPKVKLFRNATECLEGSFGEIPPMGGKERTMRELFGDAVEEFLKPTGGCGTLVAEQNGITLTSIHILRNRAAKTMSIEHTRPTHMYVI